MDKATRWKGQANPKQRVCEKHENEDSNALDLGSHKSNKEGGDENIDDGGKGEQYVSQSRRDTAMRTKTQHNAY